MVAPISLLDFRAELTKWGETNTITSRKMVRTENFSTDGTSILLGGLPLANLAIYQISRNLLVDSKGVTAALAAAKSTLKTEATVKKLVTFTATLNAALAKRVHRSLVVKSSSTHVEGIVTELYKTIDHETILDLMMEQPQFENAVIQRRELSARSMDLVVMLDGSGWKVDGGMKSGIWVRNGLLGTVPYGYTAMLFFLKCTNGLVDSVASEAYAKKHMMMAGSIDMERDIRTAIGDSGQMFAKVEEAKNTKRNTRITLVELTQRGVLDFGPLLKAAEYIESAGGVGDEGDIDSNWGLAQVLTAAARGYSLNTYGKIGTIASEIIFKGPELMLKRPVIDRFKNFDELYGSTFGSAT